MRSRKADGPIERAAQIEPAIGLFAAALLILGNAFFVATEFALVAVDRRGLEQVAKEGRRGARSAMAAIRTLSFQLSGAQFGITATSLLLGFIIEDSLGAVFEPVARSLPLVPEGSTLPVAVGLALAIATAIQMVIAELVPQNLGVARPLPLALALSAPLRAFNWIFRPVILLLNSAANKTVRLMGIEPREELVNVHSIDELEILIQSSHAEGAIAPEEHVLLVRSINFADKTASDALRPRVALVTVQQDEPVSALMQTAVGSGHSRFPVIGSDIDDIVGVVHVKDGYAVAHEFRSSTLIASIMQEPLVVPESRPLDTLLLEMRRDRKQIAVVVDEYGGTAGIITLEDLLEEIVGEIEDEYDPRSTATLTSPLEGAHVVSGLLHPDEVVEATGFEMPEGDYDTLAGFLLALFDRIPSPGDQVAHKGWELKVISMERNRIAEVLLVRTSAEEPEEEDA